MRAFSLKRTAASHLLWLVVASEMSQHVVAFLNLGQVVAFRIQWRVVASGKLWLMASCRLWQVVVVPFYQLHGSGKFCFFSMWEEVTKSLRNPSSLLMCTSNEVFVFNAIWQNWEKCICFETLLWTQFCFFNFFQLG